MKNERKKEGCVLNRHPIPRRGMPARMRRFLIVLAVLAVAAAAAVTTILLLRDAVIPAGAAAKVAVVGRRVAALENGRVTLYTLRGKTRAEFAAPGAEALDASDGLGAAWGKHDAYLFTPSGKVRAHVTADDPIVRVSCGAGVWAVATLSDGGACAVTLYDAYANQIDRIANEDFADGDVFVDAGLSKSRLWVLCMNTSGAQTDSRIYFFDAAKSALLARIDAPGQTIAAVAADENCVFAIGTKQIICYNHSGIRQWQRAWEGMSLSARGQSGGSAALVFSYDGNADARVLYRGQETTLSDLSGAVCVSSSGALYYARGATLTRCRLDNISAVQKERTFDTAVQTILAASARRIVVFDGARWQSCAM